MRDGGSYEDRMGAVACWNAVMDENDYMVQQVERVHRGLIGLICFFPRVGISPAGFAARLSPSLPR
jgi:hypothetical protein